MSENWEIKQIGNVMALAVPDQDYYREELIRKVC